MNKLIVLAFSAVVFNISSPELHGQDILTLEEVFSTIENNNYDLKLAEQNISSAEILTSKYNRGYLPTLGLNSGLNFGVNSQRSVFNFNFPDLEVNNATNYTANITATGNYLLFDNGQRQIRNEKNLYNLSYARLQLDNLSQIINYNAAQIYYSIVQLSFNENLLKESLEISKERLKRSDAYYEFGNRSKVDVLNAMVDVTRDSISLISTQTNVENLKWQLNQITLREDVVYEIDTTISLEYQLSTMDLLENQMLNSNLELISLQQNQDLVNYDFELATKTNSPSLNAFGDYNINYQKNSLESQLDHTRTNGLRLGLNANWNIIDGGQRNIQEQLAKVNQSTAELDYKNKKNELVIQLKRLWNNYQNAILSMHLESQNIKTNELNFERVKELYNNGQQSSVEFRQAQLNLLSAQSQFYTARVNAKIIEIEIDYLLGQ